MEPDNLLTEAEANLRTAAGMVQQQGNPAVITALASYAGALATLAGVKLAHPSPTPEQAAQHIQNTLDGEHIPG